MASQAPRQPAPPPGQWPTRDRGERLNELRRELQQNPRQKPNVDALIRLYEGGGELPHRPADGFYVVDGQFYRSLLEAQGRITHQSVVWFEGVSCQMMQSAQSGQGAAGQMGQHASYDLYAGQYLSRMHQIAAEIRLCPDQYQVGNQTY